MLERRLTSVPANLGSPYVFFTKGHAEFFREFWHYFAKNRTYDLLNLRYPVRPLSLPEHRLTSVLANSGTPYVLFLAKLMPKKFVNFGMTLLKIGHMENPKTA